MRIRYLVIFFLLLGGVIATLEYSGIVNFFNGRDNNKQHLFLIEDKNFIQWAKSYDGKDPSMEHRGELSTSFFEGPIILTNISKNKDELSGDFNTGYQQYTLSGKFEINWQRDTGPALRFDILSGNIKTIYGSASRVSGTISFYSDKNSYNADGTFNVGTLSYGGISFQGNQIKIDGPVSYSSGSLTGEIVGHTGSVLESTGFFKGGQLIEMKGVFSVQSPYHLIQTVYTIATGKTSSSFTKWKDVLPLTFLFEETPKSAPENRRYAIRIENMDDQFRGLISLTPELNLFRIVLESKELSGYPLEYNQTLETGDKISKVYADLILNGRNEDDRFGYAD